MEELDYGKRGEKMNKLRELIDFLASPRVNKVIRNPHLHICGQNVTIEIEPKNSDAPLTIRCRTEEALKQVEDAIKIKNA